MAGSIFAELLRRNWRQMLYWGLGLGIAGYYIMFVIPDAEALQQYNDLVQSMPPFVLDMVGAETVAALVTPEGFVGTSFFNMALLLLAVFAVVAGINITANEEEAGILDVLLSLPVPRWRVILERYAAYALMTVGIAADGFVGLLVGSRITTLPIDTGRLLGASLNLLPVVLMLIAFTTCMAALARRRMLALALTIAFIVASYFLDFLAKAASQSVIAVLGKLSFFTYYDGQGAMTEGLNAGHIAILLAAAGVLIAAALWFFQRRDIGV